MRCIGGAGPEKAGSVFGLSSVEIISMIVGPQLRPGSPDRRRSAVAGRFSARDIRPLGHDVPEKRNQGGVQAQQELSQNR